MKKIIAKLRRKTVTIPDFRESRSYQELHRTNFVMKKSIFN